MAERLEEREGHSPTDEHRVGSSREGAQDPDLVLYLGPAENHDKRPCRLVEQAGENLDLASQQAPGRRRQVLGWAHHRGVRPMRGAERVVDVSVVAFDELEDERRVVCLLAWREAKVLEQLNAADQLRKS